MFDTVIAVVGNALTMPEWRRLERTGSLVANFKIASTSRRYDRTSDRWIDGDSLRLRVNCWRRLAEGVVASVKVGDPLVVTGRLYTREWMAEDGTRRTIYELEAVAVGHDLSRGIAAFKRGRFSVSTSEVDDAEADTRVVGEASEAVPELTEASAAIVSTAFEDEEFFQRQAIDMDEANEPVFPVVPSADADDPFADLGSMLAHGGAGGAGAGGRPDDGTDAGAGADGASRGRRGRGRVPANA